MSLLGTDIEEDLILLDARLKQLRMEYEQYFLGSRKREPQLLRGEVQKIITYYANVPIRNTGHRFKFNNLRSRFFSFRRHWDDTQRKIEDGTYEQHRFQADAARARARRRGRGARKPAKAAVGRAGTTSSTSSIDAWVEARAATRPADGGPLAREARRAARAADARPSASASAQARCASASWSRTAAPSSRLRRPAAGSRSQG